MEQEEKEFLVKLDRELITIKHDVWVILGFAIAIVVGLVVVAWGVLK